jgi:hypothetical protein
MNAWTVKNLETIILTLFSNYEKLYPLKKMISVQSGLWVLLFYGRD